MKINFLKKQIIYNDVLLIILAIGLFVAYKSILIYVYNGNDLYAHAIYAREMSMGQRSYPGNFLVYLTVNLLTFFSSNLMFIRNVLCLLIALATTYRFYLAKKKIKELLYSDESGVRSEARSTFYALSLLFVFVIPVSTYMSRELMYLGNYVPNVWHNSTILISFPFALILFDLSYRQLVLFNAKRNWLIFWLIILIIFIKPSFVFVFFIVYPLFLLFIYKFKKEFWYSIFPLFVGFLFLIFEYWIIYKVGSSKVEEASSVVFMPFYRNPSFSGLAFHNVSQIIRAMFFSMLFPLLYTTLNFTNLFKKTLFGYCVLSFFVSVLIFLFISEAGPRASDGNFYWQIVIFTWICFFLSLFFLIKDFEQNGNSLKNITLLIVYLLHVVVGIIYFIRLFVTGWYI